MPATPAQIEAALQLCRARLSQLHQLANERDDLMRKHSPPLLPIADLNLQIKQGRADVRAARVALKALLEEA